MQIIETTNMERIKAGIWDIHEGITNGERQEPPKEDNIMIGTLPLYKYINNLGQRYLLQGTFEESLRRQQASNDFVSTVVTDEQFHSHKAAEDLRYFGVNPESVNPLPATQRMIDFFHTTERRDPRLLLAIHYVIEGSNNGAMFIAKAVKKAYGLEGNEGTYHLQPYGLEIRDKWKEFAVAFNRLSIDDSLMAEMIAVGRETFAHMNTIGAESHALPE